MAALALKAARLADFIQKVIDVELQQVARVISRPACRCWRCALESKRSKVDTPNKGIDHANRCGVVDVIVQVRQQQRRLMPMISNYIAHNRSS